MTEVKTRTLEQLLKFKFKPSKERIKSGKKKIPKFLAFQRSYDKGTPPETQICTFIAIYLGQNSSGEHIYTLKSYKDKIDSLVFGNLGEERVYANELELLETAYLEQDRKLERDKELSHSDEEPFSLGLDDY